MHYLDSLFHPRGIAIIGASNKPGNWATSGFLNPLLDFGYKGGVYPVNLTATPVSGLKAYSRVSDVPGPVDYVVLSVPIEQAKSCLEDCASKGVKFVCIYTAGFSESGLDEGKRQETEFLRIAKDGGMRLLGPNCIGIYNPGEGISFSQQATKKRGTLAYISQSGRFCNDFLSFCEQRGLAFSKAASFGNALDINETDLLEYLGQDQDTEIVTAYIEGIRDSKGFSRVLREVSKRKPVIIVKGGFTEAGRRAALSHTSSISGREEVWNSLIKQSGAIAASSLEEMSDIAMTFTLLKNLKGKKAALVGAGGGANVLASDALSLQGFIVPHFNEDIQSRLRQFIPFSGTWVVNPVDFSPQTAGDPVLTSRAIEVVGNLEELDILILHYMIVKWGMGGEEKTRTFARNIIEVSKKIKKPLAIVLETHGYPEVTRVAYDIKRDWINNGLCVYPDIGRAALCLGKLAQYSNIA